MRPKQERKKSIRDKGKKTQTETGPEGHSLNSELFVHMGLACVLY